MKVEGEYTIPLSRAKRAVEGSITIGYQVPFFLEQLKNIT
jgi:hypothetical protein